MQALILRPLNIDRDAEALHGVYGDEGSSAYLLDPATKTVSETAEMLRAYSRGDGVASWIIADTEDGPALGRVAMIPRQAHVFEAAVMLRPDATGRGLAYRALALALDRAFGEHGARRVFADIDPDNGPSIRLFERLGFRREGLLRANWTTHLGVRDTVMMGLIDSDPRPWRA